METMAHLEANLSAAEQLGSSEEYKTWFKAYVRQLADTTSIARLEEVFSDLLGPAHASSNWTSHIVGIPKRNLLAEALPIVVHNPRLQRLASKYKESLQHLENNSH